MIIAGGEGAVVEPNTGPVGPTDETTCPGGIVIVADLM